MHQKIVKFNSQPIVKPWWMYLWPGYTGKQVCNCFTYIMGPILNCHEHVCVSGLPVLKFHIQVNSEILNIFGRWPRWITWQWNRHRTATHIFWQKPYWPKWRNMTRYNSDRLIAIETVSWWVQIFRVLQKNLKYDIAWQYISAYYGDIFVQLQLYSRIT